MIALSISLIFLCAPVALVASAAQEKEEYTVETTFYNNGGKLTTTSHLSKGGIIKLIALLNTIVEMVQEMNQNITNVTESISKILEQKFPLLSLLSSLSNSGPFHEKVLIVSNGYGKRIDLKTEPKVNFFRFFTVWHYFGSKEYLVKSQTVIIDPVNGKIRILTGWQIGIMRNFIGLYVKIRGSVFDKDRIFFMGFASKVAAFDLPDSTNFE